MLDDEWITTGSHHFIDCWCGHTEANPVDGKTLNAQLDRVHRWVTVGCGPACELQSRVHGHVHIHCPMCGDCC